jgi:hypothetical protein
MTRKSLLAAAVALALSAHAPAFAEQQYRDESIVEVAPEPPNNNQPYDEGQEFRDPTIKRIVTCTIEQWENGVAFVNVHNAGNIKVKFGTVFYVTMPDGTVFAYEPPEFVPGGDVGFWVPAGWPLDKLCEFEAEYQA